MAIKNRTDLKSYFETGDIPTQGQYVNLIDSQLNLSDTSTQIVAGEVSASSFKAENHITASGNISSSGTVTAATLTVNSYSDINLSGDLTASGNISASGTIYASSFDNVVATNITASGNISSSGTITGNVGTFTTLTNVNTTNITASGDISSSGTITGNSIVGTLATAAQTNITSIGTIGTGTWQGTAIASAYLDADTAHLTTDQTFSGNKKFSAPITSSANISSSATLIANAIDIRGDITSSGNISGSGTWKVINGAATFTTVDTGQGANELYDMNQNVKTDSSPEFAGIKISGTEDTTTHTWDSPTTINGRAFSLETNIPSITANRNSTTQAITNDEVTANSVIVGTTSTDIGVVIVSVTNGSFRFYLANTGTGTTTSDTSGTLNFIVLS